MYLYYSGTWFSRGIIFIAGMISEGFGHVINVSSIWGKGAPSSRSAYASAKFAIIGLMDTIRHEVSMLFQSVQQGFINVGMTESNPLPILVQSWVI